MLAIHPDIMAKLDTFIETGKIPHIVFHGPGGSGKRHVLNHLIDGIYTEKVAVKKYVRYINCAHNKGIRFIRDELKFFAKMIIHHNDGNIFKSIVLFNADKLTTDAQSALRRCIEQFSHTTRFFIVIEEQSKLLRPILSRFCNIYVPLPDIDGAPCSLHVYRKNAIHDGYSTGGQAYRWLKRHIGKRANYSSLPRCAAFAESLYERGYSAMNLLSVIENDSHIQARRKATLLVYFDKIRREFRTEKLLMLLMINFTYMRPELDLENIE